jgi:hypothetical protein
LDEGSTNCGKGRASAAWPDVSRSYTERNTQAKVARLRRTWRSKLDWTPNAPTPPRRLPVWQQSVLSADVGAPQLFKELVRLSATLEVFLQCVSASRHFLETEGHLSAARSVKHSAPKSICLGAPLRK